jgi:short subunit dehydrogenase-like uncharacterized protein
VQAVQEDAVSEREFDVVLYGASGYTGRLVAEYLNGRFGAGGELRWAMAGRSLDKLAAVRDELGIDAAVPLVVADASAPETLRELAARSRCVLTTVGPYQLYGAPLVAACATEGTDYVDLCGEPAWMRQMIDAHEQQARDSGARIVFSCGFDSIPFDLGVYFLQQAAQARFGTPFARVRGRVREMVGGFSGGTAASLQATLAAAAQDPQVLALLRDPFSLVPGFEGPAQPAGNRPEFDDALDSWVAPFIMAPINTRNVHRSNALLGHAYGAGFVYDEMWVTGPGDAGKEAAEFIARTDLLGGENAPKPGEGPSKEERDNGHYDVLFIGSDASGRELRAGVRGDRDPGYGSTSKMIAESALCLVFDCPDLPGGIWTPAAAMKARLIERLEAHAGLTFALED